MRMPDREKVKTGIFEMLQRNTWKDIDKERHRFQPVLNDALALMKKQEADIRLLRLSVDDAIALLKGQPEIVRCIDCKWYDERISMCDNCGLPREQTFFCADGKRRNDDN